MKHFSTLFLFIPKAIFIVTHEFYLKYFKKQDLEIFAPFGILIAIAFGNLISIHILFENLGYIINIDPRTYLFVGLLFSYFFIYFKQNYLKILEDFKTQSYKTQKNTKAIGFIYVLFSFIIFMIMTVIFTNPK